MSVYVGPLIMAQMIADTPGELLDMAERLKVPDTDVPTKISPKLRQIAVTMGAIELSRREFVAKLEEINDNGRGLGPNLAQICR